LILSPEVRDVTSQDFAKRLVKNAMARPVTVLVHGEHDGEAQVETLKRALPGLTVKDVRTEQRPWTRPRSTSTGASAISPPAQRRILTDLHGGNKALGGKKALIVDDDIRNIFALTSVLEEHHLLVVSAEKRPGCHQDAAGLPGHRRGLDGHHDAADGRHGDHAADPAGSAIQGRSDHRGHRQGDEGRS
jgi:hypothetical protein